MGQASAQFDAAFSSEKPSSAANAVIGSDSTMQIANSMASHLVFVDFAFIAYILSADIAARKSFAGLVRDYAAAD